MAQLSSTNILGNLTVSNNATVNNTLTVNEGVYSGSLYLEEDASSPYYLRLYSDSGATANRTLTLNTNNADRTISLSGNLTVSSTATISGTNTGDQTSVSGNAGSASQAYITSTNTTGTYYVPFVGSSASGNQGLNVYTSLAFNPNTGVLTTTTFSGALSGNASTATKLATARNIFGISFDGSSAISHTATAGFAKFDSSGNFTTTDTNTYSLSTHTHNYAGSASAGGAANSVANALTFSTGITVNSGTTFDGSAARTISVAYGTTASTACVGNDSRLSDSRPASDVYAWAKAASKPTYTYSEVGAQASSTNLTSLAGLSYSSTAFVKMTGANTFTLDTTTYSASSHTHNYAGSSTAGGTANSAYSLLSSGTKAHLLGESSNWDAVGAANLTTLGFQGHNQFWIGAGNSSWYSGSATSLHHDLLISTMQGDASYTRGITFAVDNAGTKNSGWRLGRWISSTAQASSQLIVDGSLGIGYNTASTGKVTLQYNSTEAALDFIIN